jgi:hypothetical protein
MAVQNISSMPPPDDLRDYLDTSRPIVLKSGTAENSLLTDAWAYCRFTNNGAVQYTVQKHADCPFIERTEITLEQTGSGSLTVVAAPGVTILSRGADLIAAGQYAVLMLKLVAFDTWILTGDL